LPEADVPYDVFEILRSQLLARFKAGTLPHADAVAHAERHAGFSAAEATWLPIAQAHQALAADLQEGDPPRCSMHGGASWPFGRATPPCATVALLLHQTTGSLIARRCCLGPERLYARFNLAATPADLAAPPGNPLPVAVSHRA